MKPQMKRRRSTQSQAATNYSAFSPAVIPFVHFQVCHELAISLSSFPMLFLFFISFPFSASSPMIFSLFHGFLHLRLSRQSTQRLVSLSEIDSSSNFFNQINSQMTSSFNIYIYIYIYINHFDQLELLASRSPKSKFLKEFLGRTLKCTSGPGEAKMP